MLTGVLLPAIALTMFATGTPAAEWSVAPTFSIWEDHDSNRYLVPHGTPSEGTWMSFDLQLRYATDRLSVSLHPQGSVQRFSSAVFARSNDLALGANASWLTERSTFAFTGLLGDQNLLTTELPITGIVEPGERRRDEDASVSWTYSQSERRSLTLQAGYTDVNYTSDVTSLVALQSYHGTSLGATEQLQHSDRLAAYVTLSASSYTQQGLPAPSRTDGVVVGFKSQLSERTTLNVDAGVSRTSFLSLTSNGFLGDLTLSRVTETGSFSLTASRSVAPAGFGEITQQDTIKASAQRDLTARWSGDASVSAFRYSSVFSIPGLIQLDLTYLDRTYAQAALGLTWHASETWSVSAHILGTKVEGPSVPSADDWQARLQGTWTPVARSISR